MVNASNFTRGFTPASNPERGNNTWATTWAFIYVKRAKAKNSVISYLRVPRVRNGQCKQFHERLYPCQHPRKGYLMLLSHCGEYMANGLTNAVRHEFIMIANDRQTFVSVRKHSRSFLWCFECYAGLTSGECMENGLTNAIRHQFAMIAK